MGLKVKGKSWVCNNACGKDCCSEVFLILDPEQRIALENTGRFITDNTYTDWRWLGYHDSVKVTKLEGGKREIQVPKYDKIVHNEFIGKDFVVVVGKCKMLMPDKRCKVYRSRPEICKKADCVVYSKRQSIRWFGKQGLLKDVVKD